MCEKRKGGREEREREEGCVRERMTEGEKRGRERGREEREGHSERESTGRREKEGNVREGE